MDFDVTRAIPVGKDDKRQPQFDVSRAVVATAPAETKKPLSLGEAGGIVLKNLKEAPAKVWEKDIVPALQVIRWPFWRFIEHPVATVVSGAQEGKPVGETVAKAAQAFVPFKKIPKEEYGSYGKVWDNYYQASAQLKGYAKDEIKTPDWYVAMASYGSAMAVENPAIKGATVLTENAMTRVATAEEATAIRAHFEPLKEAFTKRGLNTKDLHAEGNIIKVDDANEVFMNKYVSAVLRGDEVRVPRWAKVKMPIQAPAVVKAETTGKELAPRPFDIYPATGPEVTLKNTVGPVTAPTDDLVAASKEPLPPQEIAPALEEPTASVDPAPTSPAPTDKYEANRQYFKTVPKPSTAGKDFSEFVNKTFVPISTRLSKIDDSLKDAIRQHAFKVNMSTKADMDSSMPFMKSMSKMDRDDMIDLDFALKNGDVEVIEKVAAKYGIQEEYKQVRKTLDNLFTRAKDAGMDVGHVENYYPRRITDVDGYLKFLRGSDDWGSISKALLEEKNNLGRDLKEEEKAEVINKMIRGFGKEKIAINKPSNIKERKIRELTPQMNAFYKDSGVALSDYIRAMNDNIEARVFFGKEKNLENSIGNYVSRLVEDDIINQADEDSVRQILKAYFDKRGTHGAVTGFKNFSYIATMGSPISAVTQIGDLALSLYKNGYYGTAKAILKSGKITKEDIGLDIIAEEFTDQSKSAKAVSKVFKAIGLNAMDAFGKEVIINGAFDRLSKLAANGDAKLSTTLQRVFGNKADEVMADLKNQVPTDDVKYMLFSELADMQPIALTEMPEHYVKGGNMRIFYMLKSYTIKQWDIYHNEIFREKDGGKAVKNAFKLAAALALMGATSDTVKDILLGRKTKLEDLVIDNMLKLVGFSKWQLHKTRQDGFFQTMLESILPPVPFLDDMYKDAMKSTNKKRKDRPTVDELRIWQRIPVVGKFYYWWFGGGQEIKRKENKRMRD